MNKDPKNPADDESIPASFKDITSISDERMKELDALVEDTEREMAAINLIPLNEVCEKYIHDRYPVCALYGRYDIKEIAHSEHEATLTEDEIQEVSAAFYDDYPDEIRIAISDAIETVVRARPRK